MVAKRLTEWRGLPFEAADIALTPGAFGAIAVALHALRGHRRRGDLLDPALVLLRGDDPGGRRRSREGAGHAHDHDLDVEAIAAAITPRTRMVIINTPNNPTGRIYPAATLTALASVLAEASDSLRLADLSPFRRTVCAAGLQRCGDGQPRRLLPQHPDGLQLRQGAPHPRSATRMAGAVSHHARARVAAGPDPDRPDGGRLGLSRMPCSSIPSKISNICRSIWLTSKASAT